MPRSKRQRIVPLTKTRPKGKDAKSELYTSIQSAISAYSTVYLFSVHDMRNTHLKQVREEWKEKGRFFFGRVRVMQKALEDMQDMVGLKGLTEKMSGQVGLFFSSCPVEEVLGYFSKYKEAEYARTGHVVEERVVIPAGRVSRGDEPLAPSLFETVQKLGMPVYRDQGHVALREDYVVCEKGDTLTPNQAQLLKLFYHPLAEFSIRMTCYWTQGECHEV